ncbi:MAG: arylesterase [Saprospiraceae bacterium]|nr:arylesterase [Pyrinomonadaceae bacterium]
MPYLIRTLSLVSFIFLPLLIAACGSSNSKQQAVSNSQRPLATPNIVSNKPKIVAFGDSLTAGFGLSEKESYPYLLQEKLNADGYDYEVINAGVSGETSLGGVERIDWVLEQENLQVLILELGANDLLRGVPVAKMKDNLEKIIIKAKAKNVRVLFCGMLAPPAMGSDYQRDYSEAFPDLADKYKLAYLPFLLEGIALNKGLNQADGIHPNAEGAKIMTENIYKELKPLLGSGA